MSKNSYNSRDWLSDKEIAALDKGLSPIEFLTDTFRDAALGFDIRMEAAKALLPYTARRAPQAVELTGANGGSINFQEKSAIRSKLANLLGIDQ